MIKFSRAVLVASISVGIYACADTCREQLVKCRYECHRNAEVCQLKNTDIAYCQSAFVTCNVGCDNAAAACDPHWY